MSARSTRILLLQGIIPHYRIPIFDRLAGEVALTVAHSDRGFDHPNPVFEPHFLTDRQVGRLHYQTGVGRLARGYDCVIAMFDLYWLANVRLCLARGTLPFVWWGHGYGRRGDFLRTALVRRADVLLLYDEAPRSAFVAQGIPDDRIVVAPNTVEVLEPFLVDDAAQRTSFLFVGRLQERKRVDLLIEAFAKIVPDVPAHVNLDIVGDGVEADALKVLASRLGVADRVHFHGRLTDERALRDVFARALAYVSPGHVGLGVLHACAYGVPVVTRPGEGHAPEVSNVREGETGWFVPAEVDALAAKLAQLAVSPDEAHRVGAIAHRHYVDRRTPDHMIAGFLEAIDLAMRARGG